MRFQLSRSLYLLAILAWVLLLWPNPITIFMAACFSSLSLPVYRKLRRKAALWRRGFTQKDACSRVDRFLGHLCDTMPCVAYTVFILASLLVPVAILALLVSPQALAGYTRLRELQANNFQLPPHWVEYFHAFRRWLEEYPTVGKLVNDTLANLDSMFSDAVGMLVSRGFGFVGGTMSAFWVLFLFFTLTVLFTINAAIIRKTTARILRLSPQLISRFLNAIHRALKAIMLGIVFVALVQGAMCGVGFAVAGVNQPAFWGMLATVVAPIPAVGTALVWLPLCISLWFTGNGMAAVGLAIWGTIFVAGVDNVLRPFFLRQGIRANFFVLILSILCGLSVFGAVGLVAGPVLLAIAMQAYEEANRYYRGGN